MEILTNHLTVYLEEAANAQDTEILVEGSGPSIPSIVLGVDRMQCNWDGEIVTVVESRVVGQKARWTLERGQELTKAISHRRYSSLFHVITASSMRQVIREEIAAALAEWSNNHA